ncbi:MAG: hypothetical protein DMG58_27065 [Acidobacteria bacterium]|nr:MAG: hypothetical protein DMG58_27065 [Acidobacteriota bacterium]
MNPLGLNNRLPWRTAFKIAWREAHASSAKFLFVIAAVAIGVGSLAGVRGFSSAFYGMLLREARTLMAADLSVRVFALPDATQSAVMEKLEQRGVRRTWITETLSMVSSGTVANPVLVSIKAIDPRVYPFYGAVKLDPPGSLPQVLTPDTVAVSEDLLLRLRVAVGDSVRLGGQPFRIIGKVASEPDRMSGSLNVGPRVMISREGLDRTGLIGIGSRAAERYLFRLTPGAPRIEEVRQTLQKVFPDSLIADFRQTHPIITQGREPHRAHCGRARRGHGHGRSLAAEDGFNRHHEMHRCAYAGNHADLFAANHRPGSGWRPAGGGFRNRGRSGLSAAHRALFPFASGTALGPHNRHTGTGDRYSDDTVVHFADAAWNPAHQARRDLPARDD